MSRVPPQFIDFAATTVAASLPNAPGQFVEIKNDSGVAVVVDRGPGTAAFTQPANTDKVYHVVGNASELRVALVAGAAALQIEVWQEEDGRDGLYGPDGRDGHRGAPRVTKFQTVLFAVARRMGTDPLRNFQQNTADAIAGYLDQRHREGWEDYQWPEICPVVRRTYAATWNATRTYQTGDVVWDEASRSYYRSIADWNTGWVVGNGLYWAPTSCLDRMIPLESPGFEPMAEVFAVWADDPYRKPRPRRVDHWWLSDRGVEFGDRGPNEVWIEYRQRAPVFTATPWSAGTAYQAGDVVYFTDGDCYEAVAATSAGQSPDVRSHPELWRKQLFLRVLRPFAENSAYADAMEESGETDKATTALTLAENRLADAEELYNAQQAQTARFGVRRTR